MKLGFDNERYLQEQSEEIRRRAGRFGKLYLEFGGKLMNDFHAARCLPRSDPNVKLRLLQILRSARLSLKLQRLLQLSPIWSILVLLRR